MKIVGFDEELMHLILKGEKTATWRMFDDKDLSKGDEVLFGNSDKGKEVFAKALLTNVDETQIFKDMYNNWGGHESYGDIETMVATFQKYYPDEKITEESPVKVIDFEILERI